MSQEKCYFLLSEIDDNSMELKVNGSFKDLVNLFANVLEDSEDMANVIRYALLAVEFKNSSNHTDDEDGANEQLSELFDKFKPEAQA